MNELTDLEICKRIAEIKHGKVYIDSDDTGNFINLNHTMSDRGGESYNPLTNDALCFQLMVKHKVNVWFFVDEVEREIEHGCAVALAEILGKNGKLKGYKYIDDIKDINRAVCLAIIESQKGK